MSEPVTSYDVLPYPAGQNYWTHPDCLETVAALHGVEAAPRDRCRVLELGCADGGNLIGMADSLPESTFVGIDLSPRQVAEGQAVIRALGLTNIRLEARSVTDVDDSLGQFDYVICHGVYSWVPEPVQRAILRVCKRNLSPNGVAFVSYNTLPGWRRRGYLRDLFLRFDDPSLAPMERLDRAMEVLKFAAECQGKRDTDHARFIRKEAEDLPKQNPHYLFHEYLESDNRPIYFRDFMAAAAGAGLAYLGEPGGDPFEAGLTGEQRGKLDSISPTRLDREQNLDLLANQQFRRTLLVHPGRPVRDEPDPAAVMGLYFTARSEPVDPKVDLTTDAEVEFRNAEDTRFFLSHPVVKAAVAALAAAWPNSLRFAEVWDEVSRRLPALPEGSSPEMLARALLQLYQASMVVPHRSPPLFTQQVSERPEAFRYAQLCVTADRLRFPNLRHQNAELVDFDKAVLRLLDGTRTRADLVEELTRQITAGEFTIRKEGQPLTDPTAVRETMVRWVGPSLERLATLCMLVR